MEETRERDIWYLPPVTGSGIRTQTNNGIVTGTTTFNNAGVAGHQVTTSSGHPWPPSGEQRDRDIGGDFFTEKTFFRSNSEGGRAVYDLANNIDGVGFGRAFKGMVDPFARHSGLSTSFPAITGASTDSQLEALGTTAIARTIPTNPVAGAAQFLGEIKRDGLPSLPGLQQLMSGNKPPTKLAGEYLNYEFAIKPFISDIAKFANAVIDSEKILKQYKRDSGRNVRRQYKFPLVEQTIVENPSYATALPSPAANTSPQLIDKSGVSYTRTTTTRRRTWFSGCYTYYLDPGETALGKARRLSQLASKLSGNRITPELLWELTPWSWLVDWQTNLGDVISNFSAFQNDGLVLRYGYIMEENSIAVTHTVKGLKPLGNGPTEISETYGRIRKRRIAATPYGFGTNLGGLTTRQWSILTALGISKGGFKVGM